MQDSNAYVISGFVRSRLEYLREHSDSGSTKAALASMRRGAGGHPGDIPEIWGLLFEDFPERMMSASGEPTRAEWAVYTSLTLFAVHQQSLSLMDSFMSREGMSIGRAMRALASRGDEDLERIRKRFNILVTSADMDELSHHLRGTVQLLREAGIPLDYPALAADLYAFQFPDARMKVRLRWGQDFHRTPRTAEEINSNTANTDNSI